MRSCNICHEPTRSRAQPPVCDDCTVWRRYWDSLAPEQRDVELRMMGRYAAESDMI